METTIEGLGFGLTGVWGWGPRKVMGVKEAPWLTSIHVSSESWCC